MEGSVDDLDLGIRIWFEGSISGRGPHAPRELMPYSRRKPPKWPQALSVVVNVDEPGTAVVEFDNSYSWMATKVRLPPHVAVPPLPLADPAARNAPSFWIIAWLFTLRRCSRIAASY